MDNVCRWMFGHIRINGVTLDLDSTVMTRYGAQEGAKRGSTLPSEVAPATIH